MSQVQKDQDDFFIRSRLSYLDNLQFLESGWISSGNDSVGSTPTEDAIKLAKEVFLEIVASKQNGLEWDVRKTLHFPLVQGGVSTEAVSNLSENRVIIDIENSGIVSISHRHQDVWTLIETDSLCARNLFHKALVRGDKHIETPSVKMR